MADDFFIVDVFAEQLYGGNPLAVVLDDGVRHTVVMQRIAAEINFSETVFVTSQPNANGAYRVRIFTPVQELDFAGHPILGTAWVLREYVLPHRADQIDLGLTVGQVPVKFETRNGLKLAWFEAPKMSLGIQAAREDLAHALSITTDDIDDSAPCRTVAAGTTALIVPLRSQRALSEALLDLRKYRLLLTQGLPPLIYLFTRDTLDPDNDLSARFFFEANGVREDPATGNGAAFLGAYLLEHRFFPSNDLSLRIEQGHQLNRPSLILLRAYADGTRRHVYIGGQVLPVAAGRLQ